MLKKVSRADRGRGRYFKSARADSKVDFEAEVNATLSCHNGASESSDIISLAACTPVGRYQRTSESAGRRHALQNITSKCSTTMTSWSTPQSKEETYATPTATLG